MPVLTSLLSSSLLGCGLPKGSLEPFCFWHCSQQHRGIWCGFVHKAFSEILLPYPSYTHIYIYCVWVLCTYRCALLIRLCSVCVPISSFSVLLKFQCLACASVLHTNKPAWGAKRQCLKQQKQAVQQKSSDTSPVLGRGAVKDVNSHRQRDLSEVSLKHCSSQWQS